MQYSTLFRCTDMDVLCGDSCKEGKRCSSSFSRYWLRNSYFIKEFTFKIILTLISQQKSSVLNLLPSWSWRKRPKRIRSEPVVKWGISEKHFITFFFRSVYEARARLHNSATHENPRYGFRTSFRNSELSLRKRKKPTLWVLYVFHHTGMHFCAKLISIRLS